MPYVYERNFIWPDMYLIKYVSPEEDLAQKLFDVRNEVLDDEFPGYRITRDLNDPAHKAVYTALAEYVINNFERKN